MFRITRGLMALAALGALVATLSGIPTVLHASSGTIVVETWRLCGFALFAGLFTLLALNPTGHRGVWELVIANKLVLTALAIGYAIHGHIDGTTDVLVWDGLLTVLLIAAYVSCRGWQKVDRGLLVRESGHGSDDCRRQDRGRAQRTPPAGARRTNPGSRVSAGDDLGRWVDHEPHRQRFPELSDRRGDAPAGRRP
jgi:hypothetical protein